MIAVTYLKGVPCEQYVIHETQNLSRAYLKFPVLGLKYQEEILHSKSLIVIKKCAMFIDK